MTLSILNRRAGLRAAARSWSRAGLKAEPTRFAGHTQTEKRLDTRLLHSKTVPKIPAPTPFVPDVATFFSLIGRDLSRHADKLSSWDQLFNLTSPQARKIGIEPPRTRRYLLNWLRRFRLGEYGVGGEAKFVDPKGNISLRLVEVQLSEEEAQQLGASVARGSLTATPNSVKRVLNVPYVGPAPGEAAEPEQEGTVAETGTENADAAEPPAAAHDESIKTEKAHVILPPLTPDELRQAVAIKDVKYKPGRGICGPYVQAVEQTKGQMAIISPKPGLWESRRGVKLDGGERRRAEVRFKRRRTQ